MASGIKNPGTKYEYTGYPLPDDSSWTFRRNQTADDRDAVQALATKQIMANVDRDKVKDLLRKGDRRKLEEYMESKSDTVVQMSTEKAMLGVMGVEVKGSYFVVPDDMETEDGKKHPMAGKPIPQPPPRSLKHSNPAQYERDLAEHIKWLGLFDPDERSEILTFMTAVWAGGNPEELKTFQRGSGHVDKSAGRNVAKESA